VEGPVRRDVQGGAQAVQIQAASGRVHLDERGQHDRRLRQAVLGGAEGMGPDVLQHQAGHQQQPRRHEEHERQQQASPDARDHHTSRSE
jgi:hypothetical protein